MRGLATPIPIRFPLEYFDLLEQVRGMLGRRSLRLTAGSCDLGDLHPDAAWPSDQVEHYFSCTGCGQGFRLLIETYHGSGGAWEPAAQIE